MERLTAVLGLVMLLGGCHLVFGHGPSRGGPDLAAPDLAGQDLPPRDASDEARPSDLVADTFFEPPSAPIWCQPGVWCWVHPRPHGNRFHAVWIDPAGGAFAVGDAGTIYQSVNRKPWQAMASGTTRALRGVAGVSATSVVAVGDDGVILHFDGASWTLVPSPAGNKALRAVHADAAGLIAVGDGGTVLASKDGATWQPFPSALTNPKAAGLSLRAVWREGSTTVVAGDWGRIFTLDGVTSTGWVLHELNGLPTVRGLWGSGGKVIAVGESGLVRQYSGVSWTPLPSASETLHGVTGGSDPSGNAEVVAVGKSTMVRFALDGSGTTTSQSLEARDARAITIRDGQLLVVGGGGTILRGGLPGTALARELPWPGALPAGLGSEENLNGVWGRLAELFVVGDQGTIRRLAAGGWQDESPPAVQDHDLTAVFGTGGAGGPMVAAGASRTLLHRDNASKLWNAPKSEATGLGDLFALGGTSPSDLWAVGVAGGSPLVLRFDGTSWKEGPAPAGSGALRGVSALPTAVFAAGDKLLVRYGSGAWGPAWSNGEPPGLSSLRAIWARSATEVYAAGNEGLLTFDGVVWDPVQPAVKGLRAVHGTGKGVVVAVGDAGAVLRGSAGAGFSRETVTGNNLQGVWVAGSSIWVVGEAGTVLHRRD